MTVFYAIILLGLNLVIDVVYAFLDPRIQLEKR